MKKEEFIKTWAAWMPKEQYPELKVEMEADLNELLRTHEQEGYDRGWKDGSEYGYNAAREGR